MLISWIVDSKKVNSLILMVSIAILFSACAPDEEDASLNEQTQSVSLKNLGKALNFKDQCRPGKKIVLTAVGDLLMHSQLQTASHNTVAGFKSLWNEALPFFQAADSSYANLEAPAADGMGYSGYPNFNVHPYIIDALMDSGIDVVSTANNHSLDRGHQGADKTVINLRNKGLKFSGTKQGDLQSAPWYAITEAGNLRIAWLACTHHTNNLNYTPPSNGRVLFCAGKPAWDPSRLSSTVENEIRALSQRSDIDAVIVTPHWGTEYNHAPSQAQQKMAHQMAEAGATAIIGSHPHVLQPWEMLKTKDGREVLVHYSLGNFVSAQTTLKKKISGILWLNLTKSEEHKAHVSGVKLLPYEYKPENGFQMAINNTTARNYTANLFSSERLMIPGENSRNLAECENLGDYLKLAATSSTVIKPSTENSTSIVSAGGVVCPFNTGDKVTLASPYFEGVHFAGKLIDRPQCPLNNHWVYLFSGHVDPI